MPPTTSKPIEITLPSGIFAKIRPAKFLDSLSAGVAAAREEAAMKERCDPDAGVNLFVPALIARVVCFDDEQWTIQQVLELDSRDSTALFNALGPYLSGPVR